MPEPLDLGPTLRALRKDRGLTEVELARQVGITQTSVWRYEASKRLPPAELLEKMADALGVSKRVKRQLLEQLHGARTDVESARVIGQRGLGRRQGEIARMEAKATQIRNFQASVVPGLLQTPGYARTLFEELDEVGLGARREEVARALAVRLDRQTILHDPNRRFGFVVAEPVLHWPHRGAREMLAQLDRLQAVSELPNVDLAILPLGAALSLSPTNSFNVFDEDLVLVETLTEQLAIRDPSDVAAYVKAYESFRRAALRGSGARELFESAAARLRGVDRSTNP